MSPEILSCARALSPLVDFSRLLCRMGDVALALHSHGLRFKGNERAVPGCLVQKVPGWILTSPAWVMVLENERWCYCAEPTAESCAYVGVNGCGAVGGPEHRSQAEGVGGEGVDRWNTPAGPASPAQTLG